MAYRFQRRERIDDGVRRIVSEQIEKAMGELNDDSMERADVIHQVRKRCKKIRAVVRLIRPDNETLYAQENAFFRDLAGDVSALRDLDVMIETLNGLARDAPEEERERFESFRKVFEARREKLTGEDSDSNESLETLHESLNESLKRVAGWHIDGEGFDGLKKGLKKTYSRGRTAMSRAYAEGTREAFHVWRKRAKYHWYHVRLLQNVWKGPMRARARALSDLGNDLGVDHDLAVLKALCLENSDLQGGDAPIELLVALVDRRRGILEEGVRPIGEWVYTEKPKRFVKRLKKHWCVWSKE